MKMNKTQKLTILSFIIALSIVLGNFFKIPTVAGFVTLLDAGIFFTAFYFGKNEGAVVGGLSGFLIDLIAGYPQWMLFSLVIHGLQGYFAGLDGKWRPIGLLLSTIIMVGGYALASIVLEGTGAIVASILPNFAQNTVGIIFGFVLYKAFSRLPKIVS